MAAEALGYTSLWVLNSQMFWSDCYAALALVAEHNERIWLNPPRCGSGLIASKAFQDYLKFLFGWILLSCRTSAHQVVTTFKVPGIEKTAPGEIGEYERLNRLGVGRAVSPFLHND
ncbi:MAG: hypothetical protein ACPHUF_14890 [Gammaproteobacteria bacterium]